jgi:hypothetical protein
LEPTRWPFDSKSDRRLVVATTDPARLPELTTFYLFTNLPARSPNGVPETAISPPQM